MSDDDANPFDSICEVVRQPDGTLLAYDDLGVLIVELVEEGLEVLQERNPKIRVLNLRKDPVSIQDLVPHMGGMVWLAPVRLRTTGAVFLGPRTSPDTADGMRVRTGDRILVADQLDPDENGIYECSRRAHSGLGGTTWVRVEIGVKKDATMVQEGTIHGNTICVCEGNGVWLQMSGASTSKPRPVLLTSDDADDAMAAFVKANPNPVKPTKPGRPATRLEEIVKEIAEEFGDAVIHPTTTPGTVERDTTAEDIADLYTGLFAGLRPAKDADKILDGADETLETIKKAMSGL